MNCQIPHLLTRWIDTKAVLEQNRESVNFRFIENMKVERNLYDSLILWPLETETDEFRERSLTGFQGCLEAFRIRRVPIVGYISAPQSRDVVNALRVAVCPHPTVHCEKRCPNQHKPKPHYIAPPCAYVERITDRELFETLLLPGQRSAVFASRSKIITKFYKPQHAIRFFYFHTGREIARIEFPAWVADDAELLARTHALCYDQCVKGDGYPVALAEAHEQAIVRGPERQAFFTLMEREFVRTRQTVPVTQKAVNKRTRRI